MKSDGHHVVPTDGYVNNRRGNYPFGEVKNPTYTSNGDYCKLGQCKTEGYGGTVFEPGDDIKGDLARIYFYMTTCYENQISSWSSNAEASHVFAGNKYPGLTTWTLNMFLRWAEEDPVDAVETARNIAVYNHQGNRNPFVDYPGLEQYIWGTKKDQAFSYDHYDEGEIVDGILSIENGELRIDNSDYYNLAGQKVGADYKGIVVVNGKKVIKK
jgi:endonuclease I